MTLANTLDQPSSSLLNEEPTFLQSFSHNVWRRYVIDNTSAEPEVFDDVDAEPEVFDDADAEPEVFDDADAEPDLSRDTDSVSDIFNDTDAVLEDSTVEEM